MIEGGDELDRLRQQHAVAEHVARHVAHSGDPDRILLDVYPQLAEVALDRDPGALGGDPHRLVVVAVGAPGGEGVAEPEAVIDGDRVGDVREAGGALVGGDHEIGIDAVADDDLGRMDHLVLDQIVGDREQGADEDAVAFRSFREPGVAVRRGGKLLGIEAALGSGRNDHRVLDHLGLHQPEHLGAEIVAPVRPAKAAAGDRPATQVDALDPG